MKGKKGLILISILLIAFTFTLSAKSADSLYSDFQTALANGNAQEAMSIYEDLTEKISSEISSQEKTAKNAIKKENYSLYYDALSEISDLVNMRMSKEDTEKLLALIVNEDESKAVEDASWLYDNSSYYSPILSLSYSKNDGGFSFNYKRSVSVRPGESITLPSSDEIRFDSNRLGVLAGWGLTPGQIDYLPGQTITMPLTDHTLYAVWQSAVSFTDPVAGESSVTENVEAGDVVEVPNFDKSGDEYIFSGWIDETTGEYLDKSASEYTVRGSGASFTPLYKALNVSDVSASPYSALPINTQIRLSFAVNNIGTDDISDLSVSVTSENDGVRFITSSGYFKRIPSSRSGMVNLVSFVLDDSIESGESIPFTVVLEDGEGNKWESSFTMTAR